LATELLVTAVDAERARLYIVSNDGTCLLGMDEDPDGGMPSEVRRLMFPAAHPR
jgi:hypothetical protein